MMSVESAVFLLASGVEVMKNLLQLVDINTLMHFFTTRLVWAQDTKINWQFSGMTHGGVLSSNVCWRRSSRTFDDQQKLLTFGENTAEAARYLQFFSGKRDSFKRSAYKKFYNCVRRALIKFDADDIMIETLTHNPLHMKLRSMIKLVIEFERAFPDIATQFIERIGCGERALSRRVRRPTMFVDMQKS